MNITKQLVRHIPLWLTRCCIAILAGTCTLASAQTLVWSEEFDSGSAPDSEVWSYDMGNGTDGWGNWELQDYTSNAANVRVESGNLIITAVKSGSSFTSARIKTQEKLTFKYGRIEARIQTPDLGNGLWPAFWTLGNNYSSVGWPGCGEIDIMEMGNSGAIDDGVVNRRVGSHLHWGSLPNHPNYGTSYNYPSDIDGTFVTYRMDWTPTLIKTYINNIKFFEMNISGTPEFRQPHFFILNLAVGGTYTGIYGSSGITAPFPAEYKVDWIRIYDYGDTVLGGTSTIEPPIPGTNLLENPGFESGTDGWNQSLSGGSASASTAYAHEGTRSLVIDSTGAGDWLSPNLSQSFTASPGDVFNLQGYMLNPSGSPIAGGSFGLFKIEFRDSGGNLLIPDAVEIGILQDHPDYPGAESTPHLNASSATDTWIFSEVQVEAPADTATVGFYLLNVNDPSNPGPMYFDDVQAMLIGDPVLPFSLTSAVMGGNFQISFPTQVGASYQVAYKSSMTNETWIPIETIVGDGDTNSVSYAATNPACFYRVFTP